MPATLKLFFEDHSWLHDPRGVLILLDVGGKLCTPSSQGGTLDFVHSGRHADWCKAFVCMHTAQKSLFAKSEARAEYMKALLVFLC